MPKAGKICSARRTFCSAPTRMDREYAGPQFFRNGNRPDRIFNRDFCHVRINGAGVQVKNRAMHGDHGEILMMLPAGNHFFDGKTTEPEMGGLKPVLDAVETGPGDKPEYFRACILVEEHAGYGERNHNPPI